MAAKGSSSSAQCELTTTPDGSSIVFFLPPRPPPSWWPKNLRLCITTRMSSQNCKLVSGVIFTMPVLYRLQCDRENSTENVYASSGQSISAMRGSTVSSAQHSSHQEAKNDGRCAASTHRHHRRDRTSQLARTRHRVARWPSYAASTYLAAEPRSGTLSSTPLDTWSGYEEFYEEFSRQVCCGIQSSVISRSRPALTPPTLNPAPPSRSNTSTEYSLLGATQLSKPFVLLTPLGARWTVRASGRRPTTGYVPIVQTVLRVYSQIHIIPYIDIGRNEKNFDLIISVLGERRASHWCVLLARSHPTLEPRSRYTCWLLLNLDLGRPSSRGFGKH